MSWILNVVYAAVILIASPYLLYTAIFKGKYREGFAEKFLGRVPGRSLGLRPGLNRSQARDGIPGYEEKPCIWLHAVSVGEVNLLATLLDEIERRRPDVECVISTTTMTGYALAKKKYAPRTVFYCPLDFSWAVDRALRRIRPDVLLLAELELWPNHIRAAKAHGATVAVVNGRLSEKSLQGYRRIAPLVRRVLHQIDVIGVQNEEYAERFRNLGSENVQVTGSLKFDGANTDRNNPKTRELANLAGIAETDTVFLAGSTQAPEEELALVAFRELKDKYPNLRLILVPRHPDRFEEVANLLDQSGLPWQRRSALDVGRISYPPESTNGPPTDGKEFRPTNEQARILLVDTIGELGAWWGTAHIAYVGGSMGSRGGQNMIEPAAYGAAVSFGPNTWNFRDVVQMFFTAGAAIVVQDGEELTSFVRRCLEDAEWANRLGVAGQNLVMSQLGATCRTVDAIEPLLPPAHSSRVAA